jgi:putative ABC transport system ATP-binding protein
VGQPALLLADEPTGNLDTTTGAEIMALLKELNQERGLTLLVVTHDPEIAAFADRVVKLRDGRIQEGGGQP